VTKIVTIPIAFVTLILLSTTASSVFSTAHAQTNATSANQTGKTSSSSTAGAQSEQASRSIKGAITSTGQFLNNATQKIVGSKSVQTIVNESSDLLGNATVATKKFFNPK
jgi:cell division septum initiation protein DivIVA